MSKRKRPNRPKQTPRPANAAKQAPETAPKPAPKTAKQAPAARKPTREERLEAARRDRRRRALAIRAGVAVAVVAIVGGIVVWQVGNRRSESNAISAMTAGPCDFDRKSDDGAVGEHAPNPTFDLEPPAGGIHTTRAAAPGLYDTGQPPSDGELVHAMEHGDIVLWYRPGPDNNVLDGLRRVADARENDVLVVPRPNLPVAVAATTWHKRLLCTGLDERALGRFVSRWADKGPEGFTD